MKTKTIFLLLFISFYSLSSYAQSSMKAEEEKVISILKKLRSNDPEMDLEEVVIQFETTLKAVLSKKESWNYPFTALSEQIRMTISEDKKIRTFGWDSRMGGSWHTLKTLVQYKTTTGVDVFSFQEENEDMDYDDEEVFRDVVIIEIYQIGNGYLLEGWGTHGSGHEHKILAYYEFENDQLNRKSAFEKGANFYVIQIPRRNDFELEVNITAQEISHNDFIYDEEMGFYKPTGKRKTVQLQFKN
jgi:hypothetical protein